MAVLLLPACGTPAQGGRAVHAKSQGTWVRAGHFPLTPRVHTALVTVEREVLAFGGDRFSCPPGASCVAPTEPPLRDGAALSLDNFSWRTLSAPPVAFHSATSAAVIGHDVFLLAATDYIGGSTVLRYNVDADKWAQMPPPVVGNNLSWYRLVAAGDRVVAYPRSEETGLTHAFALDGSGTRWHELPNDPMTPGFDRTAVWSSPNLYLFDKEQSANPREPKPAILRLARLDLENNKWERLPDSKIVGWYDTYLADRNAITTPALGGTQTHPCGGAFDITTSSWRPLPKPPAEVKPTSACAPQPVAGALGEATATYTGVGGWIFDTKHASWRKMPTLPRTHEQEAPLVVAAGRTAVAFLDNDIWTYTPDE